MSGAQFPYSSAPLRAVKEVQFGLLSPDEIKALSVARIEYPETMDETKMRPRIGGLSDPRLGSIDRNFKCQTCGEGMADCPGHFGHIELAKPVFHIGFVTKIKKILEAVCVHCGKLKADESNPEFAQAIKIRNPKRRFAKVWEICKKKMVCEADVYGDEGTKKTVHGGCGNAQPLIRRDGLRLLGQWKKDKSRGDQPEKRYLTPSEILNVFKHISDKDIANLGLDVDFARPEWLLVTVLPVPPPPVRPSIAMNETARGEDDLTYKLADIIKANANVQRCDTEGAPAHVVNEFEMLLQYHVATYMDNNIAGQPQALQKSGRPVKSIRARLKGKEGRLRGNLMGKRVNFSARTVITGDPNIELDQVGVPKSIARTLTYPEAVTPYNIHRLTRFVRNGPNEHPGAKYIIRDTGERIDLRYHKRIGDIPLQYGWKVERHLMDDDPVLFNRQPSLHKMSMMAHRVKVMPYSTFRLNLSVTSPYNADFDGDEMNLHVPQSEETRAELSQLAAVPLQIVSPQSNKPVMGIVQDTLCGIRKLTLRDTFLNYEMVQNILFWIPEWDGVVPPPAILKPKPLWTGKQMVSMTIPSGIFMQRFDDSNPVTSPKDNGMLVYKGRVMYGVVDKKTVGSSAGGLIHTIFREKGPYVCAQFVGNIQKVVNYWLLHNGFSIGIGDTIADAGTVANVTNTIAAAKERVEDITKRAYANKLNPEPGMTLRESFEHAVILELNGARDTSGREAENSLQDGNNVKQMVSAGSKGSFINISQMSACVGQQIVEGKRIGFGFADRSLPHFTRDDYSPESKGFIENSYLRGLSPQEFFFHAMAGREGLIDTAVKTAETGYIQRRLVKALEDIMVQYDGSARNSLGDIVQFIYGEDGLDGAQVERQSLDTIPGSNDSFEKRYRVDLLNGDRLRIESMADIVGDLDVQRLLDGEWQRLCDDRHMLRTFVFTNGDHDKPLPVNLRRVIQNAQQIFNVDQNHVSDLTVPEIVDGVQQLCNKLVVVRGEGETLDNAQDNATTLFRCLVRSRLATKRITEEYRLTRNAFEWVLGDVESQFMRSLAHPGEMVGVVAAQSIGEPATQMTLNTFHYAGVSSKNVTLGVPRLKEILNVAKTIKTPALTVYLQPEVAGDIEQAKVVQSAIEHTSLKGVTAVTEIYYDPDPRTTVIEEDLDTVEAYFSIPDEQVEATLYMQSPWLLRLELDRAKMLDKQLTMSQVAETISQSFAGDLFVMWSEDNAEKLVIRCRVVRDPKTLDEEEAQEEDQMVKHVEQYMLDNISLRGIPAITRVFMMEDKQRIIDQKTGDYETKMEWILETDGINLGEVMTVEGVDAHRTYSNSFVEILGVLGIEATRTALFRELSKVIEFDGSYVNYRHMALLVDVMTSRGHLMAITRHGINRADTGALMRCSFEETVEILLEAAATAELDDCRGVSENIMLGQMAPLGTGAFEVYLDDKTLASMPAPEIGAIDGSATPYESFTPAHDSAAGDGGDAAFSPLVASGMGDAVTRGGFTEYGSAASPFTAASPAWGGASPAFGAASPAFGAASPAFGAASPAFGAASPAFGAASPAFGAASPAYQPSSPSFGGVSPAYAPSPVYDPAASVSPSYSASGAYQAVSPSFSPTSPTSQSPSSPRYSPGGSPTSPAYGGYSPTSPAANYSPTSPAANYSPTSPAGYSPTSPAGYSPTSPAANYSPTSPAGYSPTSPAASYSPTSPTSYSPTSPAGQYSPTSPRPPASPEYNPDA